MKQSTIILLSNQLWDWPSDYCRQTALALAKLYTVICYLCLEPYTLYDVFIRGKYFYQYVGVNLYHYHPIRMVPLTRYKSMRDIDKRLNVLLLLFLLHAHSLWRKRTLVLWVFDRLVVDVVRLFPRSFFVLYDCVDYVSTPHQDLTRDYRHDEQRLINLSHAMTTDSRTLYKLHKPARPDVMHVPKGFQLDNFRQKRKIVDKKGFRIGFVGTIDYRLNYGLLLSVAKQNPSAQFVFAGDIHTEYFFTDSLYKKMNTLFSLPNVVHITLIDKDEVADVIKTFDVGIIPYDVSFDFNRYCFPLKTFEYFYLGKPILATPVEELYLYSKYIFIGNSPTSWNHCIRQVQRYGWSGKRIQQQKEIALRNSWKEKVRATVLSLEEKKGLRLSTGMSA